MCKYPDWKLSDKKQVVELFWQGKSVKEIALQMQRTTNSIYTQCKQAGLSFRDRRKNNEVNKRSHQFKKMGSQPDSTRECLKCHLPFKSHGAGNRICTDCAPLNAGYVGTVYG